MSTALATFTPTAAHLSRFEEWLDEYTATVRAGWAERGADVDSQQARDALRLVRLSMTVPERPEWASPVDAITGIVGMALMPAYDEESRLIYRDCLRTYQSLSRAERRAATADILGTSVGSIERMLDGGTEDGYGDADTETALYRHYDANGDLLYVGISTDPNARASQHRAKSPWHVLSAVMDVEWFATRGEARAAERAAIADEEPLFNVSNATEKAKQRAIEYLLAHVAGGDR